MELHLFFEIIGCILPDPIFYGWYSHINAYIEQVTDEEVAAAKKNMLADVYTMLEAPLNQIENMGSQVTSPQIRMSHSCLDFAVTIY